MKNVFKVVLVLMMMSFLVSGSMVLAQRSLKCFQLLDEVEECFDCGSCCDDGDWDAIIDDLATNDC